MTGVSDRLVGMAAIPAKSIAPAVYKVPTA